MPKLVPVLVPVLTLALALALALVLALALALTLVLVLVLVLVLALSQPTTCAFFSHSLPLHGMDPDRPLNYDCGGDDGVARAEGKRAAIQRGQG